MAHTMGRPMPMRPTPLLAAVLCLVSVPGFADRSIRKNLASAADRLEEALDKNQRGSAACRNHVEPGIVQIIDAIDALRPSDDSGKYDQVTTMLSGNLNIAKLSACPDDVLREMTRASQDLAEAAQDARRRRPGPPPPP